MSSTIPSPDADSSGFWLPPTPPQDEVSSSTVGTKLAAFNRDRRPSTSKEARMNMPGEHLAGR